MASPKVRKRVTGVWTSIEGAAASVAGVTWQNVGSFEVYIAFTTSAPAEGETDAYHILAPGTAYYDKNGSAKVWARTVGNAESLITATAD